MRIKRIIGVLLILALALLTTGATVTNLPAGLAAGLTVAKVITLGTSGATYKSLPEALIAAASGDTIKLTTNFTHAGASTIYIFDKSITFDLNGKTLDVKITGATAFIVENNSQVKLLDPNNGKFNVTSSGEGSQSIGAYARSGGKLEVTNAAGGYRGAVAFGFGSEVTVYGNAMCTSGINNSYGAVAMNYGKVTVNGDIVTAGEGYIIVGMAKTPEQCAVSKIKPGYLEYTSGESYVWVKIRNYYEVSTASQFTAALASINALSAGGSGYIKLLNNITHTGASTITVSNKKIALDLNGKTLDVTITDAPAFSVINKGQVGLIDPNNGEFNITNVRGVSENASGASAGTGGKLEVTNAAGSLCGVDASDGGEVTVYGNAVCNGVTGVKYGVRVTGGGRVTVNGSITVPSGTGYILFGYNMPRAKGGYETSSAKEGYFEYSDRTSNPSNPSCVWVADNKPRVCQIVETGVKYVTITGALAAVPSAGSWTVKLLDNITTGKITQSGKIITLDLNGKTLNVTYTGPESAFWFGNCQVRLLDPDNGEFNVTNGSNGAGAYAGTGGKLEVTNAIGGKYGACAYGAGSEITVYGNAVCTSGSNDRYGAYACNGGKVTVNGRITVPAGAGYIYAGMEKTPEQYETVSKKPGYLEYTNGESYVWVKMPFAAAPGIFGETEKSLAAGYAGTSTDEYAIMGVPAPTVTKTSGNAAITWDNANKKLNIAAGLAAGTYPVVLTASNGISPNAKLTFTLTVTNAPVAPTIAGQTSLLLPVGYETTATQKYNITGSNRVSVTMQIANNGAMQILANNLKKYITWNAKIKRIEIAAGLPAGTYPVTLTASNGVNPDAKLAFNLTVTSDLIALNINTRSKIATAAAEFLFGRKGDEVLIIAAYDANGGQLLFKTENAAESLSVAIPAGAVKVQALLWKDLETMEPLCEPKTKQWNGSAWADVK